MDWVMDVSGACVALLVYRFWGLYRRLLESPIKGLLRGKIGVESE
jgi:hypothetical protein